MSELESARRQLSETYARLFGLSGKPPTAIDLECLLREWEHTIGQERETMSQRFNSIVETAREKYNDSFSLPSRYDHPEAAPNTREDFRDSALGDLILALEALSADVCSLPVGNDYRANVYDTDDERVIHLWPEKGGKSYDIRLRKRP